MVTSVMKDCNKQLFHFKSIAKEIRFKFMILILCFILLEEISQNKSLAFDFSGALPGITCIMKCESIA